MVYYTEKFYAVNWNGRVLVYDVTGSSPTHTQVVAILPPHHMEDEFYILESIGLLFVIVQYGVQSRPPIREDSSRRISLTPIYPNDGTETYGTTNFGVFEVDLAAGKLRETKQLRDKALFLGANALSQYKLLNFQESSPIIFIILMILWNHTSSMKMGVAGIWVLIT
ncbi:hypothetical protein RDI58_008643 [Solanum bulbocastanum]|uniref:KIB1-4 beta-propeller domain-containing protein n=1 Tax=Solanum bulbocastanum TaxID=147425 RepID=A0AAN8YJT0_SOLBU